MQKSYWNLNRNKSNKLFFNKKEKICSLEKCALNNSTFTRFYFYLYCIYDRICMNHICNTHLQFNKTRRQNMKMNLRFTPPSQISRYSHSLDKSFLLEVIILCHSIQFNEFETPFNIIFDLS